TPAERARTTKDRVHGLLALRKTLSNDHMHGRPQRATHAYIRAENAHRGIAPAKDEMGAVRAIVDLLVRTRFVGFLQDRTTLQNIAEEDDIGCEHGRNS